MTDWGITGVASAYVSAFGAGLLLQSLYAAGIGLVVWAVVQLLRPLHPAWVMALWTLVLVRLLVPVGFALPWSAGAALTALLPDALHPVSAGVRAAEFVPDLLIIAVACWAAGAVAALVVLWRAHARVQQVLARAILPVPAHLPAVVAAWRCRLQVRRPVQLLVGVDMHSPFTTGVRHPVIYLAAPMVDQLTPLQLDAVIGHEMAHIKSLDALWLVLEQLARALFFFHPAVRAATARIADAREAVRDLQVIAAAPIAPKAYLGAVLQVLKLHAGADGIPAGRPLLAISLGESAQRLRQRITTVSHSVAHAPPSRLRLALVLAVLGVVLLPLAGHSPTLAPAQVRDIVASPAPRGTVAVQLAAAAPSRPPITAPRTHRPQAPVNSAIPAVGLPDAAPLTALAVASPLPAIMNTADSDMVASVGTVRVLVSLPLAETASLADMQRQRAQLQAILSWAGWPEAELNAALAAYDAHMAQASAPIAAPALVVDLPAADPASAPS